MMDMDNEEIKEKVYKTLFKSDTSYDSFKEWTKTDDDGTDWMNRLADGLIAEARTSERDRIIRQFEDGFIPIDMVRALGKVHDKGLEVATINKCIAELEKLENTKEHPAWNTAILTAEEMDKKGCWTWQQKRKRNTSC